MAEARAAIDDVQADLAARVALIGIHAQTTTTAMLAAEVDRIRHLALAHGLYPAVAVTHALAAALARGERGPLVLGWLGVLHDAVASPRQDRAACDTYTAACSVRLSA